MAASGAPLGPARRAGARVQEETRVASLDEVEAEAVVVTAGPWAKPLLAKAGIELPVVATRETVGYFRLDSDRPVPSGVHILPATPRHSIYGVADPLPRLQPG